MQTYLGIRKPCSGGVFTGTMYQSGARLRHDAFLCVGVEAEIAVTLGRDLSAAKGPYDAGKLEGAVESYMAAIEVIDDRYVDWRKIDAQTLIADDFFAAACVLGQTVPATAVGDPGELIGIATINDTEVGRGTGTDVMGHPLNALAWLANALIGRGDTLKAGETVLLGSLVETQWPVVGDVVACAIQGLGRVELTVT